MVLETAKTKTMERVMIKVVHVPMQIKERPEAAHVMKYPYVSGKRI